MRVQKGAKPKRGRRPIGARAQTGAERKRKHDRARRRRGRREHFIRDYNWLAERCSLEQKLRIEQSEYRVYEIRAVAEEMERKDREDWACITGEIWEPLLIRSQPLALQAWRYEWNVDDCRALVGSLDLDRWKPPHGLNEHYPKQFDGAEVHRDLAWWDPPPGWMPLTALTPAQGDWLCCRPPGELRNGQFAPCQATGGSEQTSIAVNNNRLRELREFWLEYASLSAMRLPEAA
jgi:hypothetical protein